MNESRDELRWLAARIDQETGEGELLDEVREILWNLVGDTQGRYSDGTPVWTVYMLGDEVLNRHLNLPPNRKVYG